MSYRYGSLRGFIGVWFAIISASVLIMTVCVNATAAADSGGGSVEISATIAPVRIIVVDGSNRITQIISNGPGNITPSVHKNSPEGPLTSVTTRIAGQYAAIMRHINQKKTGVIYKQEPVTRAVRLFSPSSMSLLSYIRSENR